MNYKFPVIKNIKDVEHAIDENLFIVADKGDHIIIDYIISCNDTFPKLDDTNVDNIAEIRREFRGIIFDKSTGNIIRRPLQKFFNIGERPETALDNIDIYRKHHIFVKEDGSMIAPYISEDSDEIIWGTKMGNTDVAKQVQEWIKKYYHGGHVPRERYAEFVREFIKNGFTPIFEWCSRKQRIVLDYPQDSLILLAARHMHTGEYMDIYQLVRAAQEHMIPMCKIVPNTDLNYEFVNYTKQIQDGEGFVIAFEDGHRVKIKSDWYCQLHRVKSEIAYERGVVNLILNNSLDDLISILPCSDVEQIEEYKHNLLLNLDNSVYGILNILSVINAQGISRKDFALGLSNTLENWEKHVVFKFFDEYHVDYSKLKQYIINIILESCNKNSKFDELRKTKLFQDVTSWEDIRRNM